MGIGRKSAATGLLRKSHATRLSEMLQSSKYLAILEATIPGILRGVKLKSGLPLLRNETLVRGLTIVDCGSTMVD
jgi:hypothetical protein